MIAVDAFLDGQAGLPLFSVLAPLAGPLLEGISGLLAIVLLSLAPAMRSRRAILLTQIGASLAFVGHYLLLDLQVAALTNLLGTVQILAALLAPFDRRMSALGYGLIGVMALAGFWMWQGPVSGLGVLAMVQISLARMQRREMPLRLLLLAGGMAWIAHDTIGEAWFALTADIGAVTTGLVALALIARRRMLRRLPQITPARRPKPAAPFAPVAPPRARAA